MIVHEQTFCMETLSSDFLRHCLTALLGAVELRIFILFLYLHLSYIWESTKVYRVLKQSSRSAAPTSLQEQFDKAKSSRSLFPYRMFALNMIYIIIKKREMIEK